jgi:hypothetical protein
MTPSDHLAHAPQQDPERPIHRLDPRPPLLQDSGELLTEGEVLEHEAALRSEPREERADDRPEKSNQGGGEAAGPGRKRQQFPMGRDFGEGQASNAVGAVAKDTLTATNAVIAAAEDTLDAAQKKLRKLREEK